MSGFKKITIENRVMKKIYLSGQIDGLLAQECTSLFNEAAVTVREKYGEDSTIINPYDLPDIQNSWADYMVRDLIILKDCNVIAMLPNWVNSYGAKIERLFAEKIGLEVVEL